MESVQATESGFLAMLNDTQLGIYLAHQGQPSCDAAMRDILLVKQYKVFTKLMEMQQQVQQPVPEPVIIQQERLPDNIREDIEENSANLDAYLLNTEVSIPSACGGKVVGSGGETIRRLVQESNSKIQLNKTGITTIIQIGADSEEDLLNAQKLIWREIEPTFKSSAVVTVYDRQVMKLCSQWSELERFDFQSDTLVSVEFMNATDFADSFVWIRGWDKKKCENAECKLKAIVTANGGKVPIRPRSKIPPTPAPAKDDGLEKYPEAMNVLLLGESGVGKSTYLNAMVNYMKFNSLKQAENQGPAVLIRSMFSVNGEDVITEPTESPESAAKITSNEVLKRGESATQVFYFEISWNPQTYVFSYPANGTEKSIRIIDTPGVDDTRGFDTCKENFARILAYIADYEQIHAVCILLRPDRNRLTLAFRYCLKELLVHLHKSASTNILFCFTHSKGDSTGTWQTPRTLQVFLDDLEKERNIRIELNNDTMFYFDSESFRYLAQKKQGQRFPLHEVLAYTASWNKSAKETLRLMERITSLKPHNVNDTLTLNNTKRIIQLLSKPLAEITASIMSNRDLLNEKHREIELALSEGRSLEGQLMVEQEIPELVELGYPMTVCTASKCVKYGKIGHAVQTLYVQECHPHCYLTNVQVETCPNPALKGCAAMSGENCGQCSCSWKEHMHIRYKIERRIEKIENKQVNCKINEKKSEAEEARQFLKTLEDRLATLNSQKKEITNLCAQFSTFLEKNSILQYNDAFKNYIRYLIKSEKGKIAANAGISDEQLKNLEKYKEDYQKEVNLINTTKLSDQEVTVEDIKTSIDNLMDMADYGAFLREVKRLELLEIGTATEQLSQVIKLKGWKKILTTFYR